MGWNLWLPSGSTEPPLFELAPIRNVARNRAGLWPNLSSELAAELPVVNTMSSVSYFKNAKNFVANNSTFNAYVSGVDGK